MTPPTPIYRYALQLALADLAARDAGLAPLSLDAALADPRWGFVLRLHARKFAHRDAKPIVIKGLPKPLRRIMRRATIARA